MKRIFLFLALALLAVSVSAQNCYYYDSGKKYGFFSNWKLSPFAQMSFMNGQNALGAGGMALKQLDDLVYFRMEASVNGIKPVKGFDRNGTALAGIQFHVVDWAYLFAECGAVVNPSMAQKAGLAGSGGIGFTCNFGKYSGLLAEGGYVALQNGAMVDNMFQARIGYVVRPGITERDRVDIDITRHNAEQLGTLKEENALLKTDKKRLQEANDTLMAIQNRSLELLARLEKGWTTATLRWQRPPVRRRCPVPSSKSSSTTPLRKSRLSSRRRWRSWPNISTPHKAITVSRATAAPMATRTETRC